MKYCNKCGSTLPSNSNFCPNCGNNFTEETKDVKNAKDTPVITWIIIGILFPIIGAILYYALKKTNPKAAKILNTCSWIGFLIQGALVIFYKH